MKNKNVKMNLAEGHADITLSRPMTIAGVGTSTLRMREPTVGDQDAMLAMSDKQAEREKFMFATLCGLAPADLTPMSLRDYARLQDAYLGFTD